MRTSLVLITVLVAACGDGRKQATPDASTTQGDSGVPMPDGSNPTPDAMVDAAPDAPPPTASELIEDAKGTADGENLSLPIAGATVTYIKPQIGSTTNDPAGFTIQATQEGPALFVSVDPTTLTPAPAVGDVVSFTIKTMDTVGMQRRATVIDNYTRTATGTDVNPLVKDVTAATDLLTAIDDYESELIDITGVAAGSFGASGSGFERSSATTTGMTTIDTNFQVRVPATLRDAIDFSTGCTFTINNTPIGRFNAQTQIAAYTESDITLSNCPAPTVASAIALSPTSVRVTFSRRVLGSSLMTDGSQFTIDNGLTVSAASVDGRTVTLTTSAQTGGTTYTVTVANSLTDLQGSALEMPFTAMFSGYVQAASIRINELNANTTSCDLIEFRVIESGSLNGFSVRERKTVIFTFPDMSVQKNDIIVLHHNSGSGTCNPGTAMSETTAKNQYAAATHTRNYDGAWDVWTTDAGLTDTDNVITVYRGTTIVDAVFVSDDPAGASTAGDTEDQAAIVGAAGQWSPALATYLDAVFRMHAAHDLDATGTDHTGTTIQRIDDTDDNDKADWTTGAGAAQTWGTLNVGQSAL